MCHSSDCQHLRRWDRKNQQQLYTRPMWERQHNFSVAAWIRLGHQRLGQQCPSVNEDLVDLIIVGDHFLS